MEGAGVVRTHKNFYAVCLSIQFKKKIICNFIGNSSNITFISNLQIKFYYVPFECKSELRIDIILSTKSAGDNAERDWEKAPKAKQREMNVRFFLYVGFSA